MTRLICKNIDISTFYCYIFILDDNSISVEILTASGCCAGAEAWSPSVGFQLALIECIIVHHSTRKYLISSACARARTGSQSRPASLAKSSCTAVKPEEALCISTQLCSPEEQKVVSQCGGKVSVQHACRMFESRHWGLRCHFAKSKFPLLVGLSFVSFGVHQRQGHSLISTNADLPHWFLAQGVCLRRQFVSAWARVGTTTTEEKWQRIDLSFRVCRQLQLTLACLSTDQQSPVTFYS